MGGEITFERLPGYFRQDQPGERHTVAGIAGHFARQMDAHQSIRKKFVQWPNLLRRLHSTTRQLIKATGVGEQMRGRDRLRMRIWHAQQSEVAIYICMQIKASAVGQLHDGGSRKHFRDRSDRENRRLGINASAGTDVGYLTRTNTAPGIFSFFIPLAKTGSINLASPSLSITDGSFVVALRPLRHVVSKATAMMYDRTRNILSGR